MDLALFRSNFPRQLRYWTLHCLLNALPSLAIALGWAQLIRSPTATAAIFTAIATFILVYATLTSWLRPAADRSRLLFRSLDLGLRIRALISILSLFALTDKDHLVFLPDTWCGLAAGFSVNWLGRKFGASGLNLNGRHPESVSGFLQIYATTLLEGFILSFLLLMISFFALIILQAKDRRKAFVPAELSDEQTQP
jgi:hypothetical protein